MAACEAGDAYMSEPGQVKAAAAAWRESAPDEGEPPVDVKAWRSFDLKTPMGEVKTFRYNVPIAVQAKGYAPAFESYLRKGLSDMGPQDRKTLSVGIDTAGGFLVPEDLQTEMIRKIASMAVMRQLCRVTQTSRDVSTWPRINYTTDDIYTSGVRMTWTGETPSSNTAHRVTDPVFGQVSIPVHTAMASMPITNQLIEDAAFDVQGIATDLIGEAFALGEDNVFINGTGAAQPMGLLAQAEDEGPAAVTWARPTPTAGLLNPAALFSQYEPRAFLARKAPSVLWQTAQTSGQRRRLHARRLPSSRSPRPCWLSGLQERVPAGHRVRSYSLISGTPATTSWTVSACRFSGCRSCTPKPTSPCFWRDGALAATA